MLLSQTVLNSSETALIELKKMNMVYADARSIAMDLRLSMTYSDETATSVNSGSMKKMDDYYYSDFMGRCVLNNKKMNLVVDKKNKLILINEPFIGEKSSDQFIGLPDSIYSKYNDLKQEKKNGKTYITIIPKKADLYSQVEVILDTEKSHLIGFSYSYNSSKDHNLKRVSISYSEIKINSGLTKNDFLESKFIVLDKNQYKAVPAYKDYKIIDKRNTK